MLVCIYICVCVHIYMYVYMYVCMYLCLYIYTCMNRGHMLTLWAKIFTNLGMLNAIHSLFFDVLNFTEIYLINTTEL